jgi:hypothetical protein
LSGVAAEQIGGRCLTFPDELAEPDFGNARVDVGCDPNVADGLKLAEQVTDMSGFRRARHRLQPGKRGPTEVRIDPRQTVEFGQLLVGEAGKQSTHRLLAGTGAPSSAGALDRWQRRQDEVLGAEGGGVAVTIGSGLFVVQTAWAAASIMKGRSRLVDGRNPSMAASCRA